MRVYELVAVGRSTSSTESNTASSAGEGVKVLKYRFFVTRKKSRSPFSQPWVYEVCAMNVTVSAWRPLSVSLTLTVTFPKKTFPTCVVVMLVTSPRRITSESAIAQGRESTGPSPRAANAQTPAVKYVTKRIHRVTAH